MKALIVCVSASLLCPIFQVQAQESPSTEKTLHLMGPAIQRRAPEYAAWTITTAAAKESSGSQPPAPEPTPIPKKRSRESKDRSESKPTSSGAKPSLEPFSVVTFTKTGQIVHVERQERRAKTSDIWIVGGHEFMLGEDGQSAMEVAPPTNADSVNPLFTDLARSDFAGFDWISAKNYAGVDEIGGRPCLIFREDAKEPENRQADGNPTARARYAAVDYYSRLPVALATNGERQEYTFKSPPTAPQTPPEPVSRAIHDLSETKKDTERAPSKPF